MEVRELGGADGPRGVFEIVPRRFGDDRGHFSETWNRSAYREAGLDHDWCQDNLSLSRSPGTLRGLHYQLAPRAQTKLVQVLQGRVLDVAIDIDPDSPTRGQWVQVELTAEKGNQILVPAGFAHAFVTLEPDTVVQYKVDAPYDRDLDRSIRWDDPDIGIAWPLGRDGMPDAPVLSAKDEAAPSFQSATEELRTMSATARGDAQ